MNDTDLIEAQRLIEITNQVNERFDAYSRMVRSEITLARLMQDEVKVSMLEGALKSARNNVIKMEKQLAKVLLSTAVVDDLVGELNSVSDEADELLDEMENLGKTFDRIKMGADIIVKTVKVVAKFVV